MRAQTGQWQDSDLGGRAPRPTLRLAAQYADGYDMPYRSPQARKARMEQIDAACERMGRDPAAMTRSVNMHIKMGADEAGAITGTPQQAMDYLVEDMEVSADGLNIACRPPIDWGAYEAYLEEVWPVFHRD